MQTLIVQLETAFRAAIRAALDIDGDPHITIAQNEKFGDYQSNAAMSLTKLVAEKTGQKTNPRAVAEQVVAKLDLGAMSDERPSIAGPGFINVRLSPTWLARQLEQIASDDRLGIARDPHATRVVVDYSAPNIAKEMHVGHIRSTIIGDAMVRVLAFRGDTVVRQNHLGDWGTQFGRVVLAMWYEAAFDRTGEHEALDRLMHRQEQASAAKDTAALGSIVRELAQFHQRFIDEDADGTRYFLPYLKENALSLAELGRAYVFATAITDSPEAKQITINGRSLAELPRLITTYIQNPEEHEQERLAWEKARAVTIDACYDVYRQLNVQLADPSIQSEPLERGESFYNPMLPEVVSDLREKNLAVESEGAIVVPVPGYENPLIIQKADGGYLYGTTDLAAIRFRTHTLGAKRILYFVDARQSQHFAQVFWTAREAGWLADGAVAEHASFGSILGEDGKPFKARAGEVVKLKDLLDEAEERAAKVVTQKNPDLPLEDRKRVAHAIGVGAIKYADLSKDRVGDYVFSWEKMLAMDGNTAPYLQYAYARICSIFRKSGAPMSSPHAIAIESPFEVALAKHVLRLGEILEVVDRDLKPHHLCTYLYELATRFSAFYENCPVLQSADPTRTHRLALCAVAARSLALGLDLLGIEHPEQM